MLYGEVWLEPDTGPQGRKSQADPGQGQSGQRLIRGDSGAGQGSEDMLVPSYPP